MMVMMMTMMTEEKEEEDEIEKGEDTMGTNYIPVTELNTSHALFYFLHAYEGGSLFSFNR